jgi:hypothetical protein
MGRDKFCPDVSGLDERGCNTGKSFSEVQSVRTSWPAAISNRSKRVAGGKPATTRCDSVTSGH